MKASCFSFSSAFGGHVRGERFKLLLQVRCREMKEPERLRKDRRRVTLHLQKVNIELL
jgi:hypothetical protein